MEDQLPYRAEYAKTGRAKCKACKNPISQGELRCAAMVQSSFHDGKQANWYHSDCFFKKLRPKCTSEIAYFSTLKYDDQQKIKSRIDSNVIVPGMDYVGCTAKGKKRAQPCDALKDFSIEYAKSGQANCRACQQKIFKGEIRIKKISFDSDTAIKYGGQALWHHVECFEKIHDELMYFASGDQLPGFKSLKKHDQEMIQNTIKAKSDASAVKQMKKDPKEEAEELAIEAEMKKQNDEFYKYKTALQKLAKKDVIALITQNNQKPPESTSTVTAVDIAADLLTFGTPGKCTECKNGFYCLADNAYNCNGLLDEWAKCTSKTQDPQRTNTTIPKHLRKNYPFLNDYKGQITKRVFRNVIGPVTKKVASDETDGKPKIERERPKLYNMIFLFVGKTETDTNKLKRIISEFGGQVKTKLDYRITAVVSNPTEMEKMNQRMEHVKSLQLPVLTEEFFNQLNKNSNVVELMEQFNIAKWADVTQAVQNKQKQDEENEKKPRKSAYIKSSNSSKMTMQIKGGGAVDPDSGLAVFAHVFENSGAIYNVTLSLADLQTGQNSFYKMQILQSDMNKEQFWLFRSWGRIGTTVGGTKSEIFHIADDVIRKFEQLYVEKTNNSFGTLDFKKCPGFYNPIDIEYETVKNKFSNDCKIESKLDEPIQNLIKLIFDINQMNQTMIQFEIDMEKMPLGKLSKSQIEKAMMALNELSGLIERGAKESEFISPTNRFYTLIPHNLGMQQPPLLNSNEILKQKLEMLDSLMEIELAYSMLNDQTISDNVNPIDAHYKQLNTEMEVLDSESDEYKTLQLYVINTHAETHNNYELEIQNIYKVTRAGEAERFDKYRKLHNRKLLWHGSRITNFVGILKNGLKIAPPEAPCTGYMFGKGIYFADMVSKSANYCCPYNNNGLLLLCDVALGNMQEYTGAHYVDQLPKGKHSTKGVGLTEPNPKGSLKQGDIEIPCGQPLKSISNSGLLYNEYIIYDIEQVNVKYLVNLKFKYNYNTW